MMFNVLLSMNKCAMIDNNKFVKIKIFAVTGVIALMKIVSAKLDIQEKNASYYLLILIIKKVTIAG